MVQAREEWFGRTSGIQASHWYRIKMDEVHSGSETYAEVLGSGVEAGRKLGALGKQSVHSVAGLARDVSLYARRRPNRVTRCPSSTERADAGNEPCKTTGVEYHSPGVWSHHERAR